MRSGGTVKSTMDWLGWATRASCIVLSRYRAFSAQLGCRDTSRFYKLTLDMVVYSVLGLVIV
jgi:hypothetical protein